MEATATFKFKTENSAAAIAEMNKIINKDKELKQQVEKKPKGGGLPFDTRKIREVSELGRELLSAGSAAEALSASLTKFAGSVRMGAGITGAVTIGMALNQVIEKTAAHIDEMTDSYAQWLKFSPFGKNEEQLAGHLEHTTKIVKEQQKELKNLFNIRMLAFTLNPALGKMVGKVTDGYSQNVAGRMEAAESGSEDTAGRLSKLTAFNRKTEEGNQSADLLAANSRMRAAQASLNRVNARAAGGISPYSAEEEDKRSALRLGLADATEASRRAGRAVLKPGQDEATVKRLKNEEEIAQAKEVEAAVALNKFEAELLEKKMKQLRYEGLMAVALGQRVRGNEEGAKIIERQADNERDIADAIKEGNTELAKRLKLAGDLETKLSKIASLMDSDGKPKSQAQLNKEGREERTKRAKGERALARSNERFGLTNVTRDGSGRVIDGLDPVTGERRPISDSDRGAFEKTGRLPEYARKSFTEGGEFGSTMRPRKTFGYKGPGDDIRTSRLPSKAASEGSAIRAKNERQEERASREEKKQNSADPTTQILNILKGWGGGGGGKGK